MNGSFGCAHLIVDFIRVIFQRWKAVMELGVEIYARIRRDARVNDCSNACVARQYRLRRKALTLLVLRQSFETALMPAIESGAAEVAMQDFPGRACPGCGKWIFPGLPGSNLRADALHCSARCRKGDWRAHRQAETFTSGAFHWDEYPS